MSNTDALNDHARSPYFGMVLRLRLAKEMKRAAQKKPVYLYAPGGYGKTIAARQWYAGARGPAAWVALSISDNDPARFCKRLLDAMNTVLPGKKEHRFSYKGTKATREQICDTFASLSSKHPVGTLVIDDLHTITNTDVKEMLAYFVTRACGHLHLCLLSRSDPQEFFGDEGLCVVFAQQDLSFTLEETAELFNIHDIPHTVEQIKSSNNVTGGWPIYLSVLASNYDPAFAEHEVMPTLSEFFETRVWKLWDRGTQNTLLQLSIPDSLTPGLAASLTKSTAGKAQLEKLSRQKSAFLTEASRSHWRFHDLFREFLQAKAASQLDESELTRLHGIVAAHYFDHKEYLRAARHYLCSNDDEGLIRCFIAANRFHEDAGNQSIETSLAFTRQYLLDLPESFKTGNAFILSKCALAAFCEGDMTQFSHYADLLTAQLPHLASTYPMMLETAMFTLALDNHKPLECFAQRIEARLAEQPERLSETKEAQTHTITLNLPLFHRSMRDYSELWELRDADIQRIRETFGIMIGDEYPPLEDCLRAGIYYERNELRSALLPALQAYRNLHHHTQPETRFCVMMTLHSVFAALGAVREAHRALDEASAFAATDKGRFLLPNLQAAETIAAVRAQDTTRAESWLEANLPAHDKLHFYKIFQHFATLRALIAVGRLDEAASFGLRLLTLSKSYARPLDQIEAGILSAIALEPSDRQKAVTLLRGAIKTARPYGFTRLFVQEKQALLPLLWEIQDSPKTQRSVVRFSTRIIDEIYPELTFMVRESPTALQQNPSHSQGRSHAAYEPRISDQQKTVLQYLGQGLTYNEIADVLHIKRGTVKTHVLELYKRLGVHSTSEALVKARMLGILTAGN